eukprot:CAMPEP_0117664054 /NCGR_PEP_ID=MMETSP0804-20121206/8982_1 /TAXON_ID=1074897 /ORGANISM="Tetraselmis astigmatica, Strain CCMP880" /LENGTH=240 /DNA_ID=CAMNT_0005471195 /DNA_START=51 /DNA_END=773 /DNA_ORIENTATION=+
MAPVSMASHLSSRANVASAASLRPTGTARVAAAPLRIQCAISRAKKEEIVGKIHTKLDGSMLVMGMRFTKLSVKSFERLRRKLPAESTMFVAKNTLMRVATEQEGYEQWGAISQCCSQDNVWIFAPEEHVAATVKEVSKAAAEIQKITKANNGVGPTAEYSGAVFDGQFLTSTEVQKLESMPTKLDLITKTAVSVKMVPTKLARSVRAVPQKLAVAIKELSDAENPDREALVGDVFPKSS